MKKMKKLGALSLLTLSMAMVACGGNEQPQQRVDSKVYKTLKIQPTDATVSTKYTASIRGEQNVDIRPQISGVITKIAINEGADVKKGQTLFIIDQTPYKAALDVANANVESAKSKVATAELNEASDKKLLDKKIISNNEYLVTVNTLNQAKADLALAVAQAKNAKNDLSYTVIKSPVDGVAGMIPYRVGSLVSSTITDPLVSVSKNDKMYVYFSISESNLLSLVEESGSEAKFIEDMGDITLTLSNGSTYPIKGKIDAISGVIEQSTGTVSLRAVFDNPNQLLKDGGNGSLSIANNYEGVMVVPKSGTYEVQNKIFVYKVIDGKANSAAIDVLPTDNGKEYIVKSGITFADVIIAEGAGLVREGAVINAK